VATRKSGDSIEITRAELESSAVTAAVERAKEAAQVPLRREVGAADLTKGFNTGAQLVKTAALGVLGSLAYWAVFELVWGSLYFTMELPLRGFIDGALQTSLLCMAIVALQAFEEQSVEKFFRMATVALPLAVVLGAISGLLGELIYKELSQGNSWSGGFDQIRAIAWALTCLGVGITLGVAYRSVQKLLNGLLGGAIGGAIGGGIFNMVYVAVGSSDTGVVSRLVGFLVFGAVVGAAIGLADAVRKNLWLQIATGGMAGKQFIVYQQNAVLGSSASADITLIKDPEIAGMHVRLNQKSGGTTFEVLEGASDVLLNGEAARRGKLSDGVLLQVGGTVLQFGEKNVEMPTIA